MTTPPKSLKIWFLIHFVVDYAFAIPLFISPAKYMAFMGWQIVDPVTGRLVAAALFAIGGISLLARNASVDVYKVLLKLKLIWSFMGMTAILLGSLNMTVWSRYFLASIFFVFFLVWLYYIGKLTRKPEPKIEQEIVT